jgi:hypothetical protein
VLGVLASRLQLDRTFRIASTVSHYLNATKGEKFPHLPQKMWLEIARTIIQDFGSGREYSVIRKGRSA